MRNADLPYCAHGKKITMMPNMKPTEVISEMEGEGFPLSTNPLCSIFEQFES